MDAQNGAGALIRKLDSIGELRDDDRRALSDLPIRAATVGADQDIVRQGDRPVECCLLLEGFACRYATTSEGKRQFQSFHIPGDIPDLQSIHLKVMDHSLGTLVPCKVAYISHQSLREVCERFPRISALFWRDTLIDAAIFRQWIVNVGRRDPYQRMAHFFCEIATRMRAVGLAQNGRFELPLTQAEMADTLALSTVHVNRTLQELRAADLISLRDSGFVVRDWEGLRAAGDFDPAYLHLDSGQMA